jgi:trehalose-phosphatase
VVGVNRGEYDDALARSGADVVIGDPGELMLDARGRLTVRYLATLPPASRRWREILERIGGAGPALFLDYDGTLTPIVNDPAAAWLSEDMRTTLQGLAERFTVAVISGRSLADLRTRVGLDELVYAGSHGFEMLGPGLDETAAGAEDYLPALDAAERELRQQLAGIAGHIVERKPFDVSVHYRSVPEDEIERVERCVNEVVSRQPRLRKGHGRKVFQLQPAIDWHKGRAVLRLLGRLGLDDGGAVPVYIGDDRTDEDVFRELAGRGIGIAVRGRTGTTAAEYTLEDPADVGRFLERLRTSSAATTAQRQQEEKP